MILRDLLRTGVSAEVTTWAGARNSEAGEASGKPEMDTGTGVVTGGAGFVAQTLVEEAGLEGMYSAEESLAMCDKASELEKATGDSANGQRSMPDGGGVGMRSGMDSPPTIAGESAPSFSRSRLTRSWLLLALDRGLGVSRLRRRLPDSRAWA